MPTPRPGDPITVLMGILGHLETGDTYTAKAYFKATRCFTVEKCSCGRNGCIYTDGPGLRWNEDYFKLLNRPYLVPGNFVTAYGIETHFASGAKYEVATVDGDVFTVKACMLGALCNCSAGSHRTKRKWNFNQDFDMVPLHEVYSPEELKSALTMPSQDDLLKFFKRT